jgi:D-glycero-D-manno-heptose 1,7-bisphosphate phosphatase
VSALRPARPVILDRDGTIVVDCGYLDDPARLRFLPGAAEGLRALHQQGHPLIVVSNQSGVARGLFTLARLHEINQRFTAMVEGAGAHLAGLYYCPHGPAEGCECRKPNTRLVREAAAALNFTPADAVVIGDKSSDIELGRRLHATTILICDTSQAHDGKRIQADYLACDLLEAAQIIQGLEEAAAARIAATAAVRGT